MNVHGNAKLLGLAGRRALVARLRMAVVVSGGGRRFGVSPACAV